MNLIKSGAVSMLVLIAVTLFQVNTFAQCAGFDKFPGGIDEGKKAHVLYRDYMKADDFEKAFDGWKSLYDVSPGGSEYHFVDGIKIYKNLAEQAETAEDAEKLAEHNKTIIDIYGKYLDCYGAKKDRSGKLKEVAIRGRMGRDMYYMGWADRQATFNALKASIEAEGDDVYVYSVSPYVETALALFGNDKLKQEEIRTIIETMQAIVEKNIESNEKYREEFEATQEEILVAVEPYEDAIYDCEYFVARYKAQYDAAPNDPSVYTEVYQELYSRGCPKSHPLMAEIIAKDKDRLADKAQAAKEGSMKWQAQQSMKAGKYDEAISYLEKDIAEGGSSDNAATYYRIANIHYAKTKRYSAARSYALKAAQARPGWGKPYLLIGKLYASSGRSCGSGTGWNSQVVVWAAIDQFHKAKSIDPSISDEANKLIGKYSRYMPSREDAFQRGLKDGQSYQVGCWIQVTTKVRTTSQY